MIPAALLVFWALGFMSTGARLMIIDKERESLTAGTYVFSELCWYALLIWLTMEVMQL